MPISFPQYNQNFPPFYANANSIDSNCINNSQSHYNNSNVFNYNIISINNQNEQISNIIKSKGKKIRKKLNKKYKDKRPFDWICNRCGNLNYSFRAICNICKLPLKDNPYYKSNI
jgi:rubrerythrin